MRTIEELLKLGVYREDMTVEEEKIFVNYWFDKYESEGFSKVFCSPFDFPDENSTKYNGKKFEVIGRVNPLDEDANGAYLEFLPMWTIKFKDGYTMAAYPEEIIPSEIKNNIWRESDKKYLEMI